MQKIHQNICHFRESALCLWIANVIVYPFPLATYLERVNLLSAAGSKKRFLPHDAL